MVFELTCDTCDFGTTADENWQAWGSARDHEGEHPEHNVLVYGED